MINKHRARIRNTKKVLRKAGKNWITVSVVLLGLIGLGSASTLTTHADTNAPVVTAQQSPKATSATKTTTKPAAKQPVKKPAKKAVANPWKQYHHKMFVANKGYKLYKNNWKKVGTTSKYFHKTVTANGVRKDHKNVYYKLYKGHYLGYTNAHAVVKTNQSVYLKVPYVSQWRPISAPEGCAEASLEMLLRTDHKHISLRYLYNHLPQNVSKGGQRGNAYGTDHFGHVIKAYALARYGRRFDKHIKNISGSSVNQIKMYVQSGHPVLYYGYSSYQLPGDPNRNHCKVITAYNAKKNAFLVYDPLYYSKYGQPGTQGRNMRFDRGARFWYSLKMFAQEYAHMSGANRKRAVALMGKPHFKHESTHVRKHARHVVRRHHARRVSRRHGRRHATKSLFPALKHYSSAEKALASKKYSSSLKIGKQTKMGRDTMNSDKNINRHAPFNKTNYEKEYLYALNHPNLINGAQDHFGGMMTGIKDGLADYGQYADVNAAKRYAKKHHESALWLKNNLNEGNKHGFYFWYFTGFNDNNGGDDYNGAKTGGHKAGLTAYKEGLHESVVAPKHFKPSKAMLRYTMHHLNNTILSEDFDNLF